MKYIASARSVEQKKLIFSKWSKHDPTKSCMKKDFSNVKARLMNFTVQKVNCKVQDDFR